MHAGESTQSQTNHGCMSVSVHVEGGKQKKYIYVDVH